MIVVCAREIPRSANISTRSRKLSLNLKYQRTQRMMISRSKWRPLKRSSMLSNRVRFLKRRVCGNMPRFYRLHQSLWNHPAASAATRKRILRTVLEEIVVTVEPGQLRLALHWKGGDHTVLAVAKTRSGQHRWKTSAATEELIGDLARLAPDPS